MSQAEESVQETDKVVVPARIPPVSIQFMFSLLLDSYRL